MLQSCRLRQKAGAYGGGVAEGGGGSELAGPPEAVDGAGMLLATEPGSSKASTGAHALGPLTLPTGGYEMSDGRCFRVCCPARTQQRMGAARLLMIVQSCLVAPGKLLGVF